MDLTKTCENCLHQPGCEKDSTSYLKRNCINFSMHEYTCIYCKWKFSSTHDLFCEMDSGDDGMSCFHGDHFELIELPKVN